MKVLFTAALAEDLRRDLDAVFEELGLEVDYYNERKTTSIENLDDYEVLVAYNPFENIDFSGAKNLKLLILASTGIDHVPDYLLQRENFTVVNNYGAYGVPIAEWIVMCTIMGMKNLPAIEKRRRGKEWGVEHDMLELNGKEILMIGAGKIASEASKRLRVFGTRVSAYRKSKKPSPDFDAILDEVEFEDKLSLADVVVMTLPATPETRHILNKDRLAKMREDAVLINVSRGATIDESALIENLGAGRYRFVALDVFEKEPLSQDSPLWDMDRVFLSTHTCWMSENRGRRVVEHIERSIRAYVSGEKFAHEADKKSKY